VVGDEHDHAGVPASFEEGVSAGRLAQWDPVGDDRAKVTGGEQVEELVEVTAPLGGRLVLRHRCVLAVAS